jgi:hypothetical protein
MGSSVNSDREFLQNLYSSVRFRSPPPDNSHDQQLNDECKSNISKQVCDLCSLQS